MLIKRRVHLNRRLWARSLNVRSLSIINFHREKPSNQPSKMTKYPEYIPPAIPGHVNPPPAEYQDPSSFSFPGIHFTRNMHIDFTIDFNTRLLHGEARYTFLVKNPSATELVLDIRGLTIKYIKMEDKILDYSIDNLSSPIGNALRIRLPDYLAVGDQQNIFRTIGYSTPGNGAGHQAGGALDWLNSEQTSSGEPFAFTQCQSIHARSIVPCQDTSAVKATYSALAKVAPPYQHLTVVMSAQNVPLRPGETGTRFECGVPVPSYLIAFACGLLEQRELSNRCVVWAEPSVVNASAHELAEVEDMLVTAEKIAGPYVWGRYDLLVLPSSFPYGGMENPFLTFVTPTLLSGDRSMSNVIVHEIAHAWSGNLVSCQDTRHFWLNEGFTVKLERRIIREMRSKAREGLDGIAGRRDLDDLILSFGDNLKYSTLVSQLQVDEDPDDYFNIIPYEKGYNVLLLLEQKVEKEGGNLHDWMREYFKANEYQSINTDDFLRLFKEAFPNLYEKFEWDTWLYGEGNCVEYDDLDLTLVHQAAEFTDKWLDLFREVDSLPYDDAVEACRKQLGTDIDDFETWDAKTKHGFLTDLRGKIAANESPGQIVWNGKCPGYLEDIHGFNAIKNSEVRFMWCRLALSGCYENVLDNVNEFVSIQGRMKYIRPLYADMNDIYPKGSYATDLFAANKNSYHSIAVKMIEKDLGLDGSRKTR